MRGSPFRGRSVLVLAALAAALVIPAAVSAAGAGNGQLTPSVALPSPSSGGTTGGQAPDIFLVQLTDGADTFRKQAKAVGLKYTERFAYKSLFKGVSVRIDPNDVGKLAGIASVSRLYPAHYYTLGPEPAADPDLATAIQMTGADIAQAEGHTGAGVKVAVMDTGIDVDHPDLGGDGNAAAPHPFPNSRIIGGWDFVGDAYNADPESPGYDPVPQPDALPDDCNGHGTHVSGIIGADKASGAGGALGVAPKVSFGAYRVFGCDGSVTDDVMIAAMERIQADGMDVLNMSIGDAFNNWAGTPTAAAADALVDAGVVVVASIGNSGANGIYSAGAPGVGDKVIGVASYDNSHVQAPGFTVSPDGTAVPYNDSSSNVSGIPDPPNPPTSGTATIKQTAAAALVGPVPPSTYPGGTTFPDGCAAFPAGYFTATVALIRRGSCTFNVKVQNAEAAGALAVVLYNHSAGAISPLVTLNPQTAIPVVAISKTDGELIHNRLLTGPVQITWQTSVTAVNPTGGLISGFSSYGTEAELNLKPDIGAPGGLIRSTWPLEEGGYATISGTSMSSPHVAGAAALLKEAYPSLPASRFRDVLQNSADPAVWSLNPGLGLLDNVHRQGAGMVDIDDAINATTRIVPGKLSLGESQAGPATRTLTLTNSANAGVTYDLFHVEAIGTSGTFPADLGFWLPDTQVVFSAPSVTVPAHGSANVSVTITADPLEDDLPTGGLYGGYLVFQDHDNLDSVFSVPYAGFKGDYQSIVAIPTAPVIGKLNGPPFIKAQQTYAQATAGHHWTLQSPDEIPNVLIHFDHQVRHLELQVVDAATGAPVHPMFSNIVERDFIARNGLRPPAGGPYNTDANNDDVTAFPWDGTRMHDNGAGTPDHRKVVPDGSYKIVVKALKAGGDPKNPAHWETWTTPTIIIDRP
jgi:minor extracellular serine protease Vpr